MRYRSTFCIAATNKSRNSGHLMFLDDYYNNWDQSLLERKSRNTWEKTNSNRGTSILMLLEYNSFVLWLIKNDVTAI